MSSTVRFTSTPTMSMVDTPIQIKLEGLLAGQQVKIRARRPSVIPSITFESYAVFAADGDGAVDVQGQRPMDGTYAERDGMGLFWSMRRIDTPLEKSSATAGELPALTYTLTAECEGSVAAQTTVERTWLAPHVRRHEVRENGLVATYFAHADDMPHPGIIVLGGSEGGLNESMAALLASHGYATLALAYFGIEPLPKELVRIPIEYMQTAIDWFTSQPSVCQGWLGIHGTSKGGELALLAATRFPQLQAVVCVSSGGVVLHGIQAERSDSLPPAWIERGQAIPYASPVNPYDSGRLTRPVSNIIAFRDWYNAHLKDESVLNQAVIPVEHIRGNVLFISGGRPNDR